MLRLENVSKYYSENGVVATGFSKVNLELNVGEFVAITGESGSGKSTLLNVISGLDSFEEGEMFIMGEPTSGFVREDMEEYRKKYIGNIFQNFNLVNSYTVYQNVELVLLMSGYEKNEVPERVKTIIEKVGLSEYEKTKVSKLSGGQKQRVAIARALAKETPIIVADEPTGNLDSKSAGEIIKLLHDLSKEKLIVVVTHNYEQIEKYVTRKISMHDGNISEDKHFDDSHRVADESDVKVARNGALSFRNMMRLGRRNTFNIPTKFLLLLIVFTFICAGVISQYASYMSKDEALSGLGNNQYFGDLAKDRIIVSKENKTVLTEEDYAKLAAIDNVKTVIKNDITLDSSVGISIGSNTENGTYVTGQVVEASDYSKQLVSGRLPENGQEAVLFYQKKNSYVGDAVSSIMNKKVDISDDKTGSTTIPEGVTIVGYGYLTDKQAAALINGFSYKEAILGLDSKGLDMVRRNTLIKYCTQEITIGNAVFVNSPSAPSYRLVVNKNVPEGKMYVSEDIVASISNPVGKDIKIINKSLYFEDEGWYTIGAAYNKDNLKKLTGLANYDEVAGDIFVNATDYSELFDKGNFQSSIRVKDEKIAPETAKTIEKQGYKAFRVSDGVVSITDEFEPILNIFSTIFLVITILVLFFISYFIIKLILKSRNTYYSIIRMIGATKKNCVALLRTELFIVFNIAFAMCMGVVIAVEQGIINVEFLTQMLSFLTGKDYIILYLILCAMSMLLTNRYARSLFKKTAIGAHKEEV